MTGHATEKATDSLFLSPQSLFSEPLDEGHHQGVETKSSHLLLHLHLEQHLVELNALKLPVTLSQAPHVTTVPRARPSGYSPQRTEREADERLAGDPRRAVIDGNTRNLLLNVKALGACAFGSGIVDLVNTSALIPDSPHFLFCSGVFGVFAASFATSFAASFAALYQSTRGTNELLACELTTIKAQLTPFHKAPSNKVGARAASNLRIKVTGFLLIDAPIAQCCIKMLSERV